MKPAVKAAIDALLVKYQTEAAAELVELQKGLTEQAFEQSRLRYAHRQGAFEMLRTILAAEEAVPAKEKERRRYERALATHEGAENMLRAIQGAEDDPEVKRVAANGRGDMALNAKWLREYGDMYVGRWVALRDGNLVGAHSVCVELIDALERSGNIDGVTLLKIQPEGKLAWA